MAVQAQFGGLVLPPLAGEDGYAWQQYDYFAAHNVAGGGAAQATPPSRKRGREEDDLLLDCYAPFLPVPLPGMPMRPPSATAAASTSGRRADATPVAEDASLESELWRLHAHGAEVDAVVRAECDRLRAGLELARKRQRQALLVRAAVALRLREAEAQLVAARRRAAELEERVRHAAAEAEAWCGVARGNQAVAAGLRATLDALLLRSSTEADAGDQGEGFGESDDAQSFCCCDVDVEAADAAGATALSSTNWNGRWACRACGEYEASVLVLPCRHLCLCKACERQTDACPVCSGDKNAAIHIAPN